MRRLDAKPEARGSRLRILLFAPHTLKVSSRSGIHRVALRLAQSLPAHAAVDLVKWDDIEGQLRYCDTADFETFFADADAPAMLRPHPSAHLIDYCFAETIDPRERTILLFAETFYLCEDGNEIHSRLIAQANVYGLETAAIFYDLIPMKSAGYSLGDLFTKYVRELARVDFILAISQYSKREAERLFEKSFSIGPDRLRLANQRIVAVPLADRDRDPSKIHDRGERKTIVLLGTIEPRKQQVRVIRLFQRERIAETTGLSLVVIGGLNPRSEEEFKRLVENDPNVTWLGYSSDAQIEAAFGSARFSVFASHEEGYGLPIAESLVRGIPCLTARTGAMHEVAEGGGCLEVDIEDDAAIADGLRRLATDDDLIDRCCEEIDRRAWRSWDDYAGELVETFARNASVPQQAASAARSIGEALSSMLAGDLGSIDVRCEEIETWIPKVHVASISNRTPLFQALDPADFNIVVLPPSSKPSLLPDNAIEALTRADAWCCRSREEYDAVIERSRESELGLPSAVCFYSANDSSLVEGMTRKLDAHVVRRVSNKIHACRDNHLKRAAGLGVVDGSAPALTIIISSYNRADFIVRNIRHCLKLIRPFGKRVQLVVLDNASTDETTDLVRPFAERGDLELYQLPCNTGLLGNLHVASTLIRARHVWTIGVDDLILPGAIDRLLKVLDNDPECPLILSNFSVYHRETIAPQESCDSLIASSMRVGSRVGEDGSATVSEAASRHDNLLTAFYIIVFRSDLMAAVFNSPFTAPFFSDLSNTIPTTQTILAHMNELEVAWLEEPVIAGNAHNTWRNHRVRWHGLIMPRAFELARAAGIDPCLLRRWALQHESLLAEAHDLFPNPDAVSSASIDELEASHRVFGRPFEAAANVAAQDAVLASQSGVSR